MSTIVNLPPAMPWSLPPQADAVDEALAEKLGAGLPLAMPLARLLVRRGVASLAAARTYLAPSVTQLADPHRMLGMATAVARTRAALERSEPILIYGDYDVDGTVATVLLKTALERVAARLGTTADVRFHIPHRLREGYGMQALPLAAAAAAGVRLVISVDTGVRAFAAADEAKRLGLDLIITDHHLPETGRGMPEAVAVLNPNQPGCTYPTKDLCGAAVAFKLAHALLLQAATDAAARERLETKMLPSFLKLLAIATIADSVPLTGENRVIAALGLGELSKPSQSGLRAIMELAGIDLTRPVSTFDVGFRIAPRLNAAGRMDVATDVVDLFTTRDAAEAGRIATKLHELNTQRRATEASALDAIEAMIATMMDAPDGLPACVVLDDGDVAEQERWHRGVIGILASRVVERTGRPALVLAHEGGEAHGSGRSSGGLHLLDVLTAAHEAELPDGLFTRFGGHAAAAGFALPSHQVARLRASMAEHAARMFDATAQPHALECHGELRLGELTDEFMAQLEAAGPFGHGAPEPLWMLKNVRLTRPPLVVSGRHLRLQVAEVDGDGSQVGGMAWSRRTDWSEVSAALGLREGSRVDLAAHVRRNWHPQFGGLELDIVALRASSGGT